MLLDVLSCLSELRRGFVQLRPEAVEQLKKGSRTPEWVFTESVAQRFLPQVDDYKSELLGTA